MAIRLVSFADGFTSATSPSTGGALLDPMTTIGDIIIRNGANSTTRLGIGTQGQVLNVSATSVPAWTSQSILGLGSVGAPSYSFLGDTNTGIYSTGADLIDFAAAGANPFRIASTYVLAGVPFINSGGTVSAPAFTFSGDTDTGIYNIGANNLGITLGGSKRVDIADTSLSLSSGTTAMELRFYEPSGSGSNYSAFKAQAQAGNVTYTLPSADASGYLKSNGSGSLTWTTSGAGTIGNTVGPGSSTDNAIVRWDGTGGYTLQNSGVLVNDSNQVLFTANGTVSLPNIALSNNADTGIYLTSAAPLYADGQVRFTINGQQRAFIDPYGLHLTTEATANQVNLYFYSANGNYCVISPPTNFSANFTLELPSAQGGANTFLKNDGSGNLTWDTVSGTGDVTAASNFGTDNILIRSDGTGKGVQSSAVTVDDFGTMILAPSGGNYNEGLRILPSSNNDYSIVALGAVAGVSGTGVGQWNIIRHPSASSYILSVRYNGTDNLILSTAGVLRLPALTANKVLYSSSDGTITASSVSDTTLGYLDATSSIQTQLNTKMSNPMTTGGDLIYGGTSGTPTRLANGTAGQILQSNGTTLAPSWVTGTAVTDGDKGDITVSSGGTVWSVDAGLAVNKLAAQTANRILLSDASGFITASSVSNTTLGYLDATSSIQTQLNAKAPSASPTFSGTITTPLTASRALTTGASSELAVSSVTSTELSYVSGVTSSIQTQLNAKGTSNYSDPLTTRGDLLYRNASVTTRLAIGTSGHVLTSNGTDASWQPSASGFSDPMTTRGDIIIRNASNVTARLGAGTAGQVLQSNGTDVAWATVSTGDVTAASAFGTDNRLIRSDGTGKGVQSSGITLTDTDDLQAVKSLQLLGSTSGTVTITPTATTTSYSVTLPSAQGSANTFLKNNGSGTLTWDTVSTGDVVGPASATDNALARFDGTTGKLIQNSDWTLSDATGNLTGAGTILLAGGTAPAPAYSFSGDSDTGFYRTTTDSIGFSTGGTLRKTISTTAVTDTLPLLGANGSASAPQYSFSGDTNTGMYQTGTADNLALTVGGVQRLLLKAQVGDPATMNVFTTDVSAGASATVIGTDFVHTLSGDQAGRGINLTTTFKGKSGTAVIGARYSQVIDLSYGTTAVNCLFTHNDNSGTLNRTRFYGSGSMNWSGFNFDGNQVSLFRSVVDASATLTVPTLHHFRAAMDCLGAGGGSTSTVTTCYGLKVDNPTTWTITNAWGLHVGSSWKNYLEGQTQFGDGSASVPALSFINDTNTGFYRIGSDNLGVSLGGTLYADYSTTRASYAQITESTTPTSGGLLTAGGLGVTKNAVIGGQVASALHDDGNSGTADTIDWNNGNVHISALTGNVTYTLSNPISGGVYTLIVTQDATGGRTITWPATVKWANGVAVTPASAANAVSMYSLVWNGTNYFATGTVSFA